jgi:DNA-binding response OmpR family regulator
MGASMADPLRVLVVEDEAPLATVIADYLRREGFDASIALDGPTALDRARRDRPDLVVLDVMLPGLDGIEVCRRLRTFTDAYVIMLTARDEEVDKVVGLSVGADDYVVKPFSPRELIARIRAMLRRPRTGGDGTAPPHGTVAFADVSVDLEGRRVTRAGQPVELTRTEFDLLAALATHPKLVFTRRQLLDQVWGAGWFCDDHVVDVHIAHLRGKLGDGGAEPHYIRTVRGVGYGLGTR